MEHYIVQFYCHILPVKMIRISNNYHSHLKMSLHETQEAGLRKHNRLRALHQGTQPLKLCEELCNEAQVLNKSLE